MAESAGETEELTVSDDSVVTKYNTAAKIANDAVAMLQGLIVAGAKVIALCEKGDSFIIEETDKVFRSKKSMKKGVAFPTCISINACICHFSPLKSDADVDIQDGDVVKVDLGAHIDGFSAVLAHTFVVGASADNKVTGRKADVILAAHWASQAALRLVKPGNQNTAVTSAVTTMAESFHCKPVEGMLSHQLKQHVIDGEKAIIQNPTEAQKKEQEECEFDVHEVYAVDVIVTSGEGKARDRDTRTTIYKRKDAVYNLKMKLSRQFFSDVEKKFSTMPFTLRAFEDEKKARMGVLECVKHDLVEPFNVLWDKDGEYVAQFKFTVLLMPNGPVRITSGSLDPSVYKSEFSVEDAEMKTLLSQSAGAKKSKKKKKPAAAKETAAAATTPAATS